MAHASRLRDGVVARDGQRCFVCGLEFGALLVLHHVVPRSRGGADRVANMRLLCATCHGAVHWASAGSRITGDEIRDYAHSRSSTALTRLSELAGSVSRANRRAATASLSAVRGEHVSGGWTLQEALQAIITYAGFSRDESTAFVRATRLVLKNIPAEVRPRIVGRVLADGRYLSVIGGNNLVARFPFFTDSGRRASQQILICWPLDQKLPRRRGGASTTVFGFRTGTHPCTNEEVSVERILSFTEDDWGRFRFACQAIVPDKLSKRWPANVALYPRRGR